jgi:hypothetical protein
VLATLIIWLTTAISDTIGTRMARDPREGAAGNKRKRA